jgi:hypothetical protein
VKKETQLSTEQRLLLALLGRRTEQHDPTEMLSLLHQVNWSNFLNITSVGLFPYVAFNLEPYRNLLEVPPEWERLVKARRCTAVQNLLLHHELSKIVPCLRESGIPALALKGIVLAYSAYPDLSLRPMADLDLLVPPGRREEALRVLQSLEYSCPDLALTLDRDQLRLLGPNQEYAPPIRRRASSAWVEIHSQLECSEPLFPMPVEEFWSRSTLVDLQGLRVGTLSPEDFLFHVCLHLSRHHRFETGLLPLVDLKLLLESRLDWNWAGIAERSLRYGCATWMFLTLQAARDLVGAPVPDSFFGALPQPHDPTKLRCLLDQQIWSAKSGLRVPPFVPALLAESSWRNRAHIIRIRARLVGKRELDPQPTFASLVRRTRLYLRRLLATVRIKIPLYAVAWKTGILKLQTVRQQAALLRSAKALFQLIEQESRYADKNHLAGSTSQALFENSETHQGPIRVK